MHGGNIYDREIDLDLSVSLNPLGMPEGLRDALISSVSKADRYPEPQSRSLSKMAGEIFNIPPQCIIFGGGASELIMALSKGLSAKKALLPVPCFTGYIYALKNGCEDCEIVFYRLKEENGFLLDCGIIDTIEKERPGIIFLTNPNNPNGAVIESSLLSDIISVCEKTKTELVMDECFLPFTGRDDSESYLKRLSGKRYVTVLRSFTKTFSIPGVRIGYIAASCEETADKVRRNLPEWNISTFAWEAARYCLKNLSYETKANPLIEKERRFLAESLKILGFKVYPSHCNFLLFKETENRPLSPLDKGILIRDCENVPGLSKGFYRISVKTHEENMRFLEALSSGTSHLK